MNTTKKLSSNMTFAATPSSDNPDGLHHGLPVMFQRLVAGIEHTSYISIIIAGNDAHKDRE